MNAQDHPEDTILGAGQRRSGTSARRSGGRHLAGVLLSLGVLAVIVVLAGLARTSAGRGATASLGIATQREPYTALSFVGPNAARLGFAGVQYHKALIHDHLSFRITNAEHRTQRYAWRLEFVPAGRVYRGSVFLHPGAGQTLTRTILFPCDADVPIARRHRHEITVRVVLQPTRESIDFQQQCDD